MKHIFLNLKRFDISPEKGGVNRLAPMQNWGAAIVSGTQDASYYLVQVFGAESGYNRFAHLFCDL